VRGLSATGTVADVRDRVQRYRDAGVHLPLVRPAAPHQLDALLRAFS
jgi:5,10-methylenetetrahydromethanopterin reductase